MATNRSARACLLAMCSGLALIASVGAARALPLSASGPAARLAQFAADDETEGRSGWLVLAQNDQIYQPTAPPASPQAETQPPPEVSTETEAAIDTVRARAFLGLGDYRSARTEAEMVLTRDPDNVGALRVLAAVEEASGRWRQAARHWARVSELTSDGAAAARRAALVGAHPSYIGATGFFEGSPGVDQLSGVRLDYVRRPLDDPEWSATLEHRIAEADAIIHLDGTLTKVDEDQQRLDVGVADNLSAGRVGFRVSFTNEAVGGRVSFGRTRPSGSFELTAGYDEPYWAYAAGVVNGATYNHLGASFNLWRGRLSLRGRAAANDYNVSDENSVARSTSAALGVDYALGDDPDDLRLTYILEGEDYSAIEQRTRPDLTRYQVMPFVDRLVHSIGAYKYVGDREQRFAMFGVGYRRDTENDAEGPYGAFAGETPLGGNLRVGIRAEYSDVSTRGTSNEPFAFAELYLRRQF